ncbi:MAG: peptide-methionine (R)-S-oxide reductase MsrB [Flavobacteriaceae bacterium]|nr:peptide-methionine (R)-S-oxide reductase MsrB [Flavobacteriaceae bacterium]
MINKKYPFNKSDEEWREILSVEEYHIMREKGTEKPFSGKYNTHFEHGIYLCKSCKQELYKSNSKFKSSCGWPSYDNSIPNSIDYKKDMTHGIIRTEILCSKCGSHQGHVFDDGPTKSGKRYCVNSASIEFKPN